MSGLEGVEVVVASRATLGEGPVWDARTGRIAWVDILGRGLHLTDPASGATESILTPTDVGAVAPRRAGGFIAALQDGFWIIGDGDPRRVATIPEARPELRFNDGKCDPAGRFWAGTMEYAERAGTAGLYRLEPDGTVARVLAGVTISNGLAWSADGSTMFYIDTPRQRIESFAFEVATGAVSGRRTVVDIPTDAGFPDGMTIDAEGGLWVAFWDGGAIRRYVDGRLDRTIRLPVSRPTSVAFGGRALDELFITSASTGLSDAALAAEPLAGAVFRVRPGVQGLPASVCTGP